MFSVIIIGILLSLSGLLLIVAFVFSKLKCKTAVEARVSELVKKTVPFRGTRIVYYTPVFSYSVNGKTYTAKANLQTRDKNRFPEGQIFTVYLDTANPESIRLGGNIPFLIAGIIFLAAGTLFIVVNFM